jgi:hypothetical protein
VLDRALHELALSKVERVRADIWESRTAFAISHVEVQRHAVENHKMKTRCFDHIDLRVKDMEVARKFYRKFLPQLGFVHEKPGRHYHTFYFRRRRQTVGILLL